MTRLPSAAERGGGDGGEVQEVGIVVVQHPVLGAVEQRGEPASHRAGAAAHVVHDQPARPPRQVGETDPQRVEQLVRPRGAIGGLTQP